jgi:hypothetical protein
VISGTTPTPSRLRGWVFLCQASDIRTCGPSGTGYTQSHAICIPRFCQGKAHVVPKLELTATPLWGRLIQYMHPS